MQCHILQGCFDALSSVALTTPDNACFMLTLECFDLSLNYFRLLFLYFILFIFNSNCFCCSIMCSHLCFLRVFEKGMYFYISSNHSFPDGVSLDLDLIPGILRSWARALRTQKAWCKSPRVVWEPPGTRATTPGQHNSHTNTHAIWCI